MQFPYSHKYYTQKCAGSQKITGSDHGLKINLIKKSKHHGRWLQLLI